MTSFGLELLVIVWAAVGCADPLEVEAVAWLLLVESCVVDGPFLLSGRTHIEVEALSMFVKRNISS